MSEIEHRVIPVDLLDGHKRNYRQHPPQQIQQLKASLERFQQIRSIVVRRAGERYTILAGHGVVQAARECQITEMHCDIVPDYWTDEDCTAYLVADNLHAANAVDDGSLLAELLQEQADAGYDLAALGTDDETLRQMLEALSHASNDEWNQAMDKLPSGEKSPFQVMTFTLSNAQADLVKSALDLALEDKDSFEDMGNENRNGNALAYIVKFFLDMGVRSDE